MLFRSIRQLAAEFSVSRAAVWKAVKQLRSDGCVIDSVSNKGYRLLSPADPLSETAIRCDLNEYAKGLRLILLDTVDSTNNYAKRLIADGCTEDALIAANEQTDGRGRLGRSFYSPKNTGVYMTFLLHTDLKLADAVTVTTAASVAVVRAINKLTGKTPEIKWVNDVYLNGRKLCGILTEAISDFETGIARSLIIGIGINISTTDFPEEISDRAGSLGTDRPVRSALIAAVANELTALRKENFAGSSFIDDYKRRSMIVGKEIDFYINGAKQSGTAVDIDDKGGLMVRLCSGETITLSSGEVTVRLTK